MKVRIICAAHNNAVVVPLDDRYNWLVYSQRTQPGIEQDEYHETPDDGDLLCTGDPDDLDGKAHEFWFEISGFVGFTVPEHGTMRMRMF